AQFWAEDQKAAPVRQDPIRWCRSPRLPRVAKTTARNPATRRGPRLLVAESGPAAPNRRRLLSAAWSFPDPLRRGARFHSRQKLFAAELCLRAGTAKVLLVPVVHSEAAREPEKFLLKADRRELTASPRRLSAAARRRS